MTAGARFFRAKHPQLWLLIDCPGRRHIRTPSIFSFPLRMLSIIFCRLCQQNLRNLRSILLPFDYDAFWSGFVVLKVSGARNDRHCSQCKTERDSDNATILPFYSSLQIVVSVFCLILKMLYRVDGCICEEVLYGFKNK